MEGEKKELQLNIAPTDYQLYICSIHSESDLSRLVSELFSQRQSLF